MAEQSKNSKSSESFTLSSESAMECPNDFPFTFEPYEIQKDFMRNIFQTIEARKIGLFESPTGTGKSLSIICGALTWLNEHKLLMEVKLKKIAVDEKALSEQSSATEDWLTEDYEKLKKKDTLKANRLALEDSIRRELQWQKRREKLMKDRKNKFKEQPDELTSELSALTGLLKEAKSGPDLPDSDLLPDEYNSDDEQLQKNDAASEHVIKIYYCTRTHSQVTQFIRELKRSPFGSSTRVAALASRQNLCVFEPVRKLKSLRMMNDRCIELQKGGSKKKPVSERKRTKRDPEVETSCPYYEKDAVENLSNRILDEVLDIEDAWKAGISKLGCPYYASRMAVPDAEARLQVVAVPYNLILHRPTREASGIILKNQIVIVDEAHNLMEAIVGMHSAEVTENLTKKAHWQLQQYHDRYRTRLTPKNLLHIKQLLFVLKQLSGLWNAPASGPQSLKSQMFGIDQFLIHANLETVKLFKILEYCKKSFISRKLMSFSEKYPEPTDSVRNESSDYSNVVSASPLLVVEAFLETLTNAPKDGRVTLTKEMGTGKLKFLLLNPAIYVQDIFQEARSVVLAGGTMQPFADFEDQLLSMCGVPVSRVHKFCCGHIVPADHILPIALQKGPSGKPFEFTYQNRSSEEMILQLGRLIQNLSTIVPGGIVCFFPSYDYEEKVFAVFNKSSDLMRGIERKKKVYREPKCSSDVESTLRNYANSVSSPSGSQTGALMFAVVGGKLSEGINFSDELGRCVVMVGLPFPNRNSVELQEKMSFLNSKLQKSANGRLPGDIHYENLCMKAVNQSIGRAIRHKDDYAVILLVDSRYGSGHLNKNLPQWIGGGLKISDDFSRAFAAIREVHRLNLMDIGYYEQRLFSSAAWDVLTLKV